MSARSPTASSALWRTGSLGKRSVVLIGPSSSKTTQLPSSPPSARPRSSIRFTSRSSAKVRADASSRSKPSRVTSTSIDCAPIA